MSEMHEVMGGCKICGRRMLTNGSPLVRRTRRLQGHQKARAQPRDPQGRTPRRQSKNGSTAMQAVRQAHRGSQSPRHESRAAMGAQVLRQHMP